MTTRIIETNTSSINVLTVDGHNASIEATIYFSVNESLTEVQALKIASMIIKVLESTDRNKTIENLIQLHT
jgi:hypothetical protein